MAVEFGETMDRCDSGGEAKTRPKLRGRVREQQSAGHETRHHNRTLHIRRHARPFRHFVFVRQDSFCHLYLAKPRVHHLDQARSGGH